MFMIKHKCWGIGLGRTGTTSFCAALRILGYKNVFHNPSFELLRVADGGADNGVTIYFKYLDYKFPQSKFVLTVRDVEEWAQSMKYITEKFPVTSRDMDEQIKRRMILYDSVDFNYDKFINGYYRHCDSVRNYFRDRPEDLLEMNIIAGEGWEKLCPFLDLPIPNVPFPHLHSQISEFS